MDFNINGYADGQKLNVISRTIAAQTIDYLTAHFDFTPDWEGASIWAHFRQGETVYDLLLNEDGDILESQHLSLGDGTWELYLHGNKYDGDTVTQRITTTIARVQVFRTGCFGDAPLPVEPSVGEQILAAAMYARDQMDNLTAEADTLPEGSEATASYDKIADKISFGIPKGDKGDKGDPFTLSDFEQTETYQTIVWNEQVRVNAENGRQTAETNRVSAENGRVNAESGRASAETSRASAESARASSESSRQSAETNRVSAENSRANAETQRVAAESSRSSAETSRQNAESLRASAESSRASAETARTSAETSRASAESARVSAESSRVSAESARVSAESARVTAEAERVAAEQSRVTAEQNRVEEFNDDLKGKLDLTNVEIYLSKFDFSTAFRKFIEDNAGSTLTTLCNRFYAAAGKIENRIFTSEFYKFETSQSTIGWKLDDNEGLVCEPSTNSVAGRDDYATIPLFIPLDCNYTIDADTLEPVIHAIKGVYGNFSKAPVDSFVGVIQMAGWSRRTSTATTKKVEYAAYKAGTGFKPIPEAVRASDNSVRPFVIHAKYAAGYNSAGKLSSVSGVQPATYRPGSEGSTSISHDGQITLWRQWGDQYGGSALCDIAFLQLMLEIKYAVLGSARVMSGCHSYYYSFTVAAAEDGVTRVLLSSNDAERLMVGSCVSVGTENDRTKATCYSICDIVPILNIEDVEVEGVSYKAVNLDTETTFNVPAGAYVVTHPWRTGATDDVSGNDGSPFNNTSGKEPYKLQGIEVCLGTYEIPGDTSLYETATAGDVPGVYKIYTNRLAANVRDGNSGVDPVQVGTIAKNGSAAWKYVAELNWDANDQESYLAVQDYGANSTTGYCCAQYLDAETATGWRELRAFGYLSVGSSGGLVCADFRSSLGAATWSFGARACGTAGNRGEYVEVIDNA